MDKTKSPEDRRNYSVIKLFLSDFPYFLTYGLYKDASHAQPWGSTTGQTVAGTGTGSAQNVTVYGLIPIQTSPPIGTYQDYVIVTITY